MKRNKNVNRTSLKDLVCLVMANTGMTRKQATITVDNIIAYMRQHSTDPISKVVDLLFGNNNNKDSTLN